MTDVKSFLTLAPEENTNAGYIELVSKNRFTVSIRATLTIARVDWALHRRGETKTKKLPGYVVKDYIAKDCLVGGYLNSDESLQFAIPENGQIWNEQSLVITSKIEILPVEGPTQSRETCFQSLERLLSDDTLSDFVIICNESSFKCHKAIMANKSLVFKAFFQRSSKGDSVNTYNIENFEPEIVKQMIHFIYTNKLAEDTQPSEPLLRIGDKYDVNGLVALCTTELVKSIDVDNAIRDQCCKTFLLYGC
jgi:hypothetical protein